MNRNTLWLFVGILTLQIVLFNIPLYVDDHGDGCNGKHDWACRKASLIDVVPRAVAVLQRQF